VSTPVPLCPHCAAATERPLVCDRCGWRWYANPLPAAAVLVERPAPGGGASILLLRRAVEPGYGDWDLPAGYLEAHESAEQGALREAREEAGLDVELLTIVGVYTSHPANAVSTVYLARPLDLDAPVVMDHESSAFAWVERAEVDGWLPRMAFRSMAQAVEDWAAGRRGIPRPSGDTSAIGPSRM
jgi:8-oxo-dGTP pyrophosphatase MutT (NUDIX family)